VKTWGELTFAILVVNEGWKPGNPMATSAKAAFLVNTTDAWVDETAVMAPLVGGGHVLHVDVPENKFPVGILVPAVSWYTTALELFRRTMPHSLEKAPTLVKANDRF
jgi:hypothetical protein